MSISIITSETVQRKTDREHTWIRPDAYVGSIVPDKKMLTVILPDGSIERTTLQYSPAAYKIFDEVVSNVIDQYIRVLTSEGIDKEKDPVKCLMINYEKESGVITITNSGRGIPITKTKDGIYTPQDVFESLKTGSNFDDNILRYGGGRNGFGAALASFYSKWLEVTTVYQGKLYKQKFIDRNAEVTEPIISDTEASQRTIVKFLPDYEYFGGKFPEVYDVIFRTRANEIAAIFDGHLKVFYNGLSTKVQKFSDYVSLVAPESYTYFEYEPVSADVKQKTMKTTKILPTIIGWRAALWCKKGKSAVQHSFINGINTLKGGKHVNGFLRAIVKKMASGKYLPNNLTIGNNSIFSLESVIKKISVYLVCFAPNPSFVGQTKEELSSQTQIPDIPDEVVEHFIKNSDIVEILKNEMTLLKEGPSNFSEGRKILDVFIPKLDDANYAGYKSGCTLIISEGESSGGALEKARYSTPNGADFYGVFQLKGKIRNVRKVELEEELKDVVISQFKKAMGLDMRVKYTNNTSSLRYDSLLIAADQDVDGFHITGLIINFIHHHWPELLLKDGFIKILRTKFIQFTGPKSLVLDFYSRIEYEKWKAKEGMNIDGKIKVYKGIGNNLNCEMQEYFRNLNENYIKISYNPETDDILFNEAFGKDTLIRKKWIERKFSLEEKSLDKLELSAGQYIDDYVRTFAEANIERMIAGLDGLKTVQRKILAAALAESRNKKDGIKVNSLAGKILSDYDYNNGDSSLWGAIVKMAQAWVGKAFVNLLEPKGQFGSRINTKASATRYLSTAVSRMGRALFRNTDGLKNVETFFPHNFNETQMIEPKRFYPPVPIILLNGSDSISMGWSSKIYKYSIKDITNYFTARIKEGKSAEDLPDLKPSFYGHTGNVEMLYNKKDKAIGFIVSGKMILEGNTLIINEIPPFISIDEYKTHLEKLKYSKVIKSKYHKLDDSNNRIPKFEFIVELTDDYLKKCFENKEKGGKLTHDEIILEKKSSKNDITIHYDLSKDFKNKVKCSLENMYLLDHNNKLKYYSTAKDIMEDFISITGDFYKKLYDHWSSVFEEDLKYLNSKMLFIKGVAVDKKINILRRTDEEIAVDIETYSNKIYKRYDSDDGEDKDNGYRYLTKMPMRVLTKQKVDSIQKEIDEKTKEYDIHIKMTPKDYWINDYKHFLSEMKKQLEFDEYGR